MLVNIVWFRNDLRITDNTALLAATAVTYKKALVRGVFFITIQQWQAHGWGSNKIGFVLRSVLQLQDDLKLLNIPLDILESRNFKSIPNKLLSYLQNHQAVDLFFNKEYELDETNRDNAVSQLLKNNNITCHTFHDQVVLPPEQILSKQATPYKMFTPFKRAWHHAIMATPLLVAYKPKSFAQHNVTVAQKLPVRYKKYLASDIQSLWPVGEDVAINRLRQFCSNDLFYYHDTRDIPALDKTSKLSPYLAVGAISVRECFNAALNENKQLFMQGKPGVVTWINELIWREFYKYISYHFPKISRNENFNNKYDHIPWRNSAKELAYWQQGQTGVPIIDAAMRQLVKTGWMHNRLRMLVAMFLTKNLLIDWRQGEQFFAEHLIDLDFAANNGGWQWSASTGVDAAPYFRIFNPISQSIRFDPAGKFIKQFCPELNSLSKAEIHLPSATLSSKQLVKLGYKKIIVNLKQTRFRAIAAFKKGKHSSLGIS